ncbi:MAG: hypothetical protein M1828_000924 [Chrysothrix sp. TS-e1954]|nr:MAG: hypothetical protein M1828_000924 [Chrysothrix sp. TS-e1954]
MSTSLARINRPQHFPCDLVTRPLCSRHHQRRILHQHSPRTLHTSTSSRPSVTYTAKPSRLQTRAFSSSPTHHGGKAAGYAPPFLRSFYRTDHKLPDYETEQVTTAINEQPSQPASMTSEALSDKYPEDMGLFEGTVVFPTRPNRPPITSAPWQMTKVQFRRAWRRTVDFLGLLRYKFTGGRPYRNLELRKVTSTAMAMHRNLYTAFAEGNMTYLKKDVCDGLRDHLGARLALRPHGAQYAWTLHKYLNRPRVISQRIAQLPMTDRSGNQPFVRQAVVRIVSRQTLELLPDEFGDVENSGGGKRAWERGGGEFEPLVESKDVEENFVIQKRIWNAKDEGWKIWGTVEETKWEALEGILSAELPRREGRGM